MDATELLELQAIEKYNRKNITCWHFHITFIFKSRKLLDIVNGEEFINYTTNNEDW